MFHGCSSFLGKKNKNQNLEVWVSNYFLHCQFNSKQLSYCDNSNVFPHFKTTLLADVTGIVTSSRDLPKTASKKTDEGLPGGQVAKTLNDKDLACHS